MTGERLRPAAERPWRPDPTLRSPRRISIDGLYVLTYLETISKKDNREGRLKADSEGVWHVDRRPDELKVRDAIL